MRYLTVNDMIARLELLASDGCGDHIFTIRNDSQNPLIARAIDADIKFQVTTQYGVFNGIHKSREVVVAKVE